MDIKTNMSLQFYDSRCLPLYLTMFSNDNCNVYDHDTFLSSPSSAPIWHLVTGRIYTWTYVSDKQYTESGTVHTSNKRLLYHGIFMDMVNTREHSAN